MENYYYILFEINCAIFYANLYELLNTQAELDKNNISKKTIFLTPRNNSQSSWSSKTEDIFLSCGHKIKIYLPS